MVFPSLLHYKVTFPPLFTFYFWNHWSGLPFPSLEDLPDPGIKPMSSALQADSYQLSHGRSPLEAESTFKGVGAWSPFNRDRSIYKNYLKIVLKKIGFFLSIYLINHLFIWALTLIFILYLGYNLILTYFVVQFVSALALGSYFRLAPVSPQCAYFMFCVFSFWAISCFLAR